MIIPKGDDTVQAIREWSNDQIKSGTSNAYNLGKFIFSVSITSIGIITGIKKITSIESDGMLFISLLLFFLSIIASVLMISPKLWKLDGKFDLFQAFRYHMKQAYILFWSWFVLWILGFAIGIYSIL